MKLYIALIPNLFHIEEIYKIRKQIVNLGYGLEDTRANILPHACISYLKDTDDTKKIDQLITELDNIKINKKINLKIDGFTNYDNKVVALFNSEDTRSLVNETNKLLESFELSDNQEYIEALKTPVGDHMKIVRNVFTDRIDETKEYLKHKLSNEISFDRLVLISYGFQEKDILWRRMLN